MIKQHTTLQQSLLVICCCLFAGTFAANATQAQIEHANLMKGLKLICTTNLNVNVTLEKAYMDKVFNLQTGEKLRIGTDSHCHPEAADVSPECNGVVQSNGDIKISFNGSKCSPKVTVNENLTTMSYVVEKYDSVSFIRRWGCKQVMFACSFVKKYQMVSKAVDTTDTAKESSSPKHKTVALELSLANSSFVKLNVTKPYKLNDEIYVVAGFRPAGPAEIVLQASTCFARSDDESQMYKLITSSGCKDSNVGDVNGSISVVQNSGGQIKFSFKAFYWSNPLQLSMRLKCTVKVCRKTANETCTMAVCPQSRLKRFADNVIEDNTEVYQLVSKPFYMTTPDPCKNANGGCDDMCNVMLGAVSCSCYSGREVSTTDAKKCVDVEEHPAPAAATKQVLNTDWRHGGAASSLNIIRNDLKSSNTVEVPKSYYESLLADISNKNMMLLGFAVLALMVACIGAIMTIRRGKK